jgi:hypothetical protein
MNMHRHERRMVMDGNAGPSSDPDRDMLQGEPTTSGNPTSATSNPGTVGTGSMSQPDGGRDEGARGRAAARTGIGGFGAATRESIRTNDVASYAPSLFTMALPGVFAMQTGVQAARRAGWDVQDPVTNPDGTTSTVGDAMRGRSKELTDQAAAADAGQRSSNVASSSFMNSESALNRNGYASGNRRRRSLLDSGGGGSMILGG